MPKVVIKCIEVKSKPAFCLCFCPGIENVRFRVITWKIGEISALTDLRPSEISNIKIGEELQIC